MHSVNKRLDFSFSEAGMPLLEVLNYRVYVCTNYCHVGLQLTLESGKLL